MCKRNMILTVTNQPFLAFTFRPAIGFPLANPVGVGPLKWVTSEPMFWTVLMFSGATLVYRPDSQVLISIKTNKPTVPAS